MNNLNNITLKQLRTLMEIVQSGTLSRAAERLNLTPPAVSIQLKSLEDQIGGKAIHRGPDGHTELTEIGRELIQVTQQIENLLIHCNKRILSKKSGRSGSVDLGVVSTAKYFAPQLVAMAQATFPEIEIDLFVGNRDEVIRALEQRKIELAIMGRPPLQPVVDAAVLGDHRHVLIAPPGHPLVGECDILPERLLQEIFLVREFGSGTRILIDRFLDRLGEGQVYRFKELTSNETIKQAVMAGLGIALISATTIEAEIKDKRLAILPVAGIPIVRQWFLVHLSKSELTPTAKALRQFVMGNVPNYLPA